MQTFPVLIYAVFVFIKKIRWLSLKGPNSTALQRALLHRNICVNLTVFFYERILINRMRTQKLRLCMHRV